MRRPGRHVEIERREHVEWCEDARTWRLRRAEPPDSVLYVDADAWFSDVAFTNDQVTPEAYLALSNAELLGNQNRIGGPKIPMNGGLIFAEVSIHLPILRAVVARPLRQEDQLPLWATLFASWSEASGGPSTDSSLFDRAVAHNKRGALHILRATRRVGRRAAHFF